MRTWKNSIVLAVPLVFVTCLAVQGGPYTERGICSHIYPNRAPANPMDPNAVVNPIFRGWASGVASYQPTPQYIQPWWMDPNMALGESWGNTAPEYYIYDVVSLGDLSQEDIDAGVPPGQITLSFDGPILNGKGYDFAVFENGMGPLCGGFNWCELGYVEVSTNGLDFARFPSVSLVPYDSGSCRIPDLRCIDITDVYNLAGKHLNVWGEFASGEDITGTPFDLSDLANESNVLNGSIDLNNINYVRIVDIPGSGDFFDDATHYIDPCTGHNYPVNHPIYDPWVTFGSGGFDLDAIGVLKSQEYSSDINLDGIVDISDLYIFTTAWLSKFGDDNYYARCDLAEPKDYIINMLDYAVFANQWLKVEQWRSQ